jgi:hypothetical protein
MAVSESTARFEESKKISKILLVSSNSGQAALITGTGLSPRLLFENNDPVFLFRLLAFPLRAQHLDRPGGCLPLAGPPLPDPNGLHSAGKDLEQFCLTYTRIECSNGRIERTTHPAFFGAHPTLFLKKCRVILLRVLWHCVAVSPIVRTYRPGAELCKQNPIRHLARRLARSPVSRLFRHLPKRL